MDEPCLKTVIDGFFAHRCHRKPWRDGWCKQHHPETEKTRRADREAKRAAQNAARGRQADRREKEAAVVQAARDWCHNRGTLPLVELRQAVAALEDLDAPEAKK